MPRDGELIFAVAIVNVPMARLRLFAPLRRRFAWWRLGHLSTIPSIGSDCGLASFIPALWPSLAFTFPFAHSLCCPNWDKDIRDSHHVLESLPLNQSLSLGSPEHRFGQTTRSGNAGKPGSCGQLRKDRAQDYEDYKQHIEIFLPCWPKRYRDDKGIHGNLRFSRKWGASRGQSNEKFRSK